MDEIKIGDTVRIISSGQVYTEYDIMFQSMGFKDKVMNPEWSNGDRGIVFGVKPHEWMKGEILIAIRDFSGREVLIGHEGIRFVNGEKRIIKLIKNDKSREILFDIETI